MLVRSLKNDQVTRRQVALLQLAVKLNERVVPLVRIVFVFYESAPLLAHFGPRLGTRNNIGLSVDQFIDIALGHKKIGLAVQDAFRNAATWWPDSVKRHSGSNEGLRGD
jgi:hypothetical protein